MYRLLFALFLIGVLVLDSYGQTFISCPTKAGVIFHGPFEDLLNCPGVGTAPVSDLSVLIVLITESGIGFRLSWTNPPERDLSRILIRWIDSATENQVGEYVISPAMPRETSGHLIPDLPLNIGYRFEVVAFDNDDNAAIVVIDGENLVDSDGDQLIDIRNLDMLNNIRYSLEDTAYKIDYGSGGLRCGTDGTIVCHGYELMRDLDFADHTSYAGDAINSAWRPVANSDGSGAAVAPMNGRNPGWIPIGDNGVPFTTTFEGNGYAISNLYARNVANRHEAGIGLFGRVVSSASNTIRNLTVVNGHVYGGSAVDYVGIVAGHLEQGAITNSAAVGGMASGGGAEDTVGALVGRSLGSIAISYASGDAEGGGDTDAVGGLVGINFGTITTSYAVGNTAGGTGDDYVGGLVGYNLNPTRNTSTITTSYASGDADGGTGDDYVGAFIGSNLQADVAANYAVGNADGGVGDGDRVGAFIGFSSGDEITFSYAFGNVDGNDFVSDPYGAPSDGSIKPFVVTSAADLDASNSGWSTVAGGGEVWDFGNASQAPVLKYPDGVSGDYLLPGQTH